MTAGGIGAGGIGAGGARLVRRRDRDGGQGAVSRGRRAIEDCPAETLFAQADAALLDAKRGGTSQLRMFDSHMTTKGRRRLELEADLRCAIDSGDVLVHFQPIVDLVSRRTVGVEALARWHHESRGWISPAEFIPVAERCGLIQDIGRIVLATTCRELAAWRRYYPGLTASVNVSTVELGSPDLAANVESALADHQLSPSALILEITETSMIADARVAAEAVTRLRRLGVRVVLDDFGTGYDSLNTLKRLTVDGLKIDLGFVQAMCESPKDAAIVGAILAFGQAVGVDITAEGIETTEQYDRLRRLGCGRGQGYLFGRPVSAADLTPAIIAAGAAPRDSERDAPIALWSVRGRTAMALPDVPGMNSVGGAPAEPARRREARSRPA